MNNSYQHRHTHTHKQQLRDRHKGHAYIFILTLAVFPGRILIPVADSHHRLAASLSPGRAFVYACHRLYRRFFLFSLLLLLLLLLLLSLLPYLGFYSQRCRCQPGIVAWRTAFLWHIFRCCCCLNEAFETAPKGNLVSVSHLAHCCRFKNIYTRTHMHTLADTCTPTHAVNSLLSVAYHTVRLYIFR